MAFLREIFALAFLVVSLSSSCQAAISLGDPSPGVDGRRYSPQPQGEGFFLANCSDETQDVSFSELDFYEALEDCAGNGINGGGPSCHPPDDWGWIGNQLLVKWEVGWIWCMALDSDKTPICASIKHDARDFPPGEVAGHATLGCDARRFVCHRDQRHLWNNGGVSCYAEYLCHAEEGADHGSTSESAVTAGYPAEL